MPAPIPLDSTIGVLYVCTTVSALLFGTTCLQVFLFYQRYPEDSVRTKCAVAVMWLLDSVALVLTTASIYHYVISNYGFPLALTAPTWSIKAENVFACILIPLVQSMYCTRIWILSGSNKTIPIVATASVAGVIATALWNIITVIKVKTFSIDKGAIYAPLIATVITDTILAGSLYHYIGRGRGNFARTDSVLNRLVLMIVGTGLLTSTFAAASLITYITMPSNMVFAGIQIILGRLYVNSYMSMLNARQSLRRRLEIENDINLETGTESKDQTRSTPVPASHLRLARLNRLDRGDSTRESRATTIASSVCDHDCPALVLTENTIRNQRSTASFLWARSVQADGIGWTAGTACYLFLAVFHSNSYFVGGVNLKTDSGTISWNEIVSGNEDVGWDRLWLAKGDRCDGRSRHSKQIRTDFVGLSQGVPVLQLVRVNGAQNANLVALSNSVGKDLWDSGQTYSTPMTLLWYHMCGLVHAERNHARGRCQAVTPTRSPVPNSGAPLQTTNASPIWPDQPPDHCALRL